MCTGTFIYRSEDIEVSASVYFFSKLVLSSCPMYFLNSQNKLIRKCILHERLCKVIRCRLLARFVQSYSFVKTNDCIQGHPKWAKTGYCVQNRVHKYVWACSHRFPFIFPATSLKCTTTVATFVHVTLRPSSRRHAPRPNRGCLCPCGFVNFLLIGPLSSGEKNRFWKWYHSSISI